MNALRRLTLFAVVISFGTAVGSAATNRNTAAIVTSQSTADAAAVHASLLAFQAHVDALRKRKVRRSIDNYAHNAAITAPERYQERTIHALGAKLATLPSAGRNDDMPARLQAAPTRANREARQAASLPVSRPESDQQLPQTSRIIGQASTIALPTLERFIEQAPELRLAQSDARYAGAKMAALRSRRAPELTLSTSAGAYRELVTDTLVRNYKGADLRFGVRVPLFGASAQGGALAELGDEFLAKQFDVDEARRSILLELRERYVDYWTSIRKLHVTKTYLASEPEVARAVALRVRSGLSLAGDGMQALAGYDLAKENIAHFARDASGALSDMRRLTFHELPDFRPIAPALAGGCKTQAQFTRSTLDANPGLALLRRQLEESRRLAERSPSTLRGTVTVSQGVVAQQGAPTAGRSTELGLDLALPLDSGSVVAAEREVYATRVGQVAARLKFETERLRQHADDAWNAIREAEVQLRVAQNRVGTSRESAREALLRYGSLAPNTVENLQTNRLAYYRSALDEIDAEQQLAKRRVVAVSPAGSCAPQETIRSDDASTTSDDRRARSGNAIRVYAWNSRDVLDGDWDRPAFWDRFTSVGIGCLMLSLDGGQIRDTQTAQFHDRLQRFIAAGTSGGVSIDLLLGEPHWILSDQRNRLVSIIQGLKDIPFHALELDIEPSQLSRETRLSPAQLQRQLTDTIAAVVTVSPWPVSLSANYRDFETTTSSDASCYACALRSSGLNEIVLMTYVANPQRVADLVRPILRSSPQLSFAVAQSVEPALSTQESYRTVTRPQFLDSMSRLTRLLDSEPNFSGIAVQSYRDYTAMQP